MFYTLPKQILLFSMYRKHDPYSRTGLEQYKKHPLQVQKTSTFLAERQGDNRNPPIPFAASLRSILRKDSERLPSAALRSAFEPRPPDLLIRDPSLACTEQKKHPCWVLFLFGMVEAGGFEPPSENGDT
jgi:hypothetical protein